MDWTRELCSRLGTPENWAFRCCLCGDRVRRGLQNDLWVGLSIGVRFRYGSLSSGLGVDVVKRALLLSGGLDSAAIAWRKRPDVGIFVDYGQRAAIAERRAAEAIAGACDVEFIPVTVDCSVLGSGQMSGKAQIAEAPTPEWWPFRNQLLVTMAASVALTNGIQGLIIGTVSEDASNGDGTSEFVETVDRLLRLQEGGIDANGPRDRDESGRSSADLGHPAEVASWSHSCFVSDTPCMKCRGCRKHLKVLEYTGRRWASA